MVNRKVLKSKSKDQLRGQWKIPVLITLIIFIIQGCISLGSETFKDTIGPSLLITVISIIVTLSIAIMSNSFYLKISRDKKVKFSDILISGKTWGKGMGIQLLIVLMYIPIIIIIGIVVGIIAIHYSNQIFIGSLSGNSIPSFEGMTTMIVLVTLVLCIPIIIFGLYLFPAVILVCEDNSKGVIQCIKESFKLMKGNVWSLFVLYLSFLGWVILCIVPGVVVAIIAVFSFNEMLITILPLIIGISFLWLTPYMNTTFLNFFNEISGYNNKPIYNEINTLN
ncbi:DUF975 family protein [Clostridium sp. UBA4395]|uniref:DUF975 family protein n=1 Tax=Clostridium sp. UBA4395 TaxID=1946360 RepID=UPI003216B842